MEFPKEIFSANLRRLRAARGFTQVQLAEAASISRNAYGSLERGDARPRTDSLRALAKAFGVTLKELLAAPPALASLRFRSKRVRSKKDQAKRDDMVLSFARGLRDFVQLEEMLDDRKPFVLEKLVGGGCDPLEMAAAAREALNLDGDEVVVDICELLEDNGVKVLPLRSDLDKVFGFSLSATDGGPAIAVRIGGVPVERQIFTVAHELGHLLLHPDSYVAQARLDEDEDERMEQEANQFASHFLMPHEAFLEELRETAGLHLIRRVLRIKRRFRVSYRTVLLRLVESGLATKKVWVQFAVSYKRMFGKDLKGHKEPEPLTEPHGLDPYDFWEERLACLVRKAYEEDLISFSRVAEILSLSTTEARELVKSWTLLR